MVMHTTTELLLCQGILNDLVVLHGEGADDRGVIHSVLKIETMFSNKKQQKQDEEIGRSADTYLVCAFLFPYHCILTN